ncbi:HAMP domain-containing sensor histidine kinase [Chitinimonas sp. PSY-7]|uniref:ATP-binding protein n=1 Tax=Chitinimonas sp. PSY-7 TaxID=3459088 RepID=UPI00403FDF60
MGRLFWKFFAVFWLALMLTIVMVIFIAWLLRWVDPPEQRSFEAERLSLMLRSTANVLAQGESAGAKAMLRDWQSRKLEPTIYVLGPLGQELLGRSLPADELAALPNRAQQVGDAIQTVITSNGQRYWVFAREAEITDFMADERPKPPSIVVPIAVSALVSLLLSAWLAWYFSKPIRSLSWALHTVAEGKLETRVMPQIGLRRDEIADLGRDFDRMAHQLQQLVGAQNRLLHDVSHELRSPLARLQAAIGLARQRPDKVDASLERIEREAVRLDSLVGELLTLARLEAGSTEIKRERLDLVELIAAIADDAQFEARLAGRDVQLQASGEFVAEVGAELLHRAFENVIRNAVKYTAPGTTVEVTVRTDEQGLQVEVADRGPGVAEDDLVRIFEPFRRLAESQGVAGFGLGLAIARRAIESHGGEIIASPREGGGLCLRLCLPVQIR